MVTVMNVLDSTLSLIGSIISLLWSILSAIVSLIIAIVGSLASCGVLFVSFILFILALFLL